MFLKILSLCFCLCVGSASFGQSDKRMDFFPATTNHFAGLNVYSTTTGEFNQYYVQNGQWVKNPHIPQPTLSIKGGDYRMQFLPGSETALHGLFAYSRNTGQFEILYLDTDGWKKNPFFPSGIIALNPSNTIIEFVPAKDGEVAYMTAYTVDGSQFGIYYVNGDEWDKSEFYPQ